MVSVAVVGALVVSRSPGSPVALQHATATDRWTLQELIGQPFVRPVSPTEAFDVEDLTLVSTHSSRKHPEQWADFRDPGGKVHRVRLGEAVGASGKLKKVSRSSVALAVQVGDQDEQERIVKLARRKPAPK